MFKFLLSFLLIASCTFAGDLTNSGAVSASGLAQATDAGPPARNPAGDPDDIYWDNTLSPSYPFGDFEATEALTVYDGRLIAGGCFTSITGISANSVAAWNGDSWSPLGSGVTWPGRYAFVNALAVYDGQLIAAGNFTDAGGISGTGAAGYHWFNVLFYLVNLAAVRGYCLFLLGTVKQ